MPAPAPVPDLDQVEEAALYEQLVARLERVAATPAPDRWLSLVRGRGAVVWLSALGLAASANTLWAQIEQMRAAGLSPEALAPALAQLATVGDHVGILITATTSLISLLVAAWSKARELRRAAARTE